MLPSTQKQPNLPVNSQNIHYSRFSTVQPSNHPLDLSGRSRNHSLNEVRMGSVVEENGVSGKELRRLRGRLQELEGENRSLYKLSVEYEEEMKVWQEKARQLNQELIQSQNRHLSTPSLNHKSLQQHHLLIQQIQLYKSEITALKSAHAHTLITISNLTATINRLNQHPPRQEELQLNLTNLQMDYEDVQRRFEREEQKCKKSQEEVEKLQCEVEDLTCQIGKLKIQMAKLHQQSDFFKNQSAHSLSQAYSQIAIREEEIKNLKQQIYNADRDSQNQKLALQNFESNIAILNSKIESSEMGRLQALSQLRRLGSEKKKQLEQGLEKDNRLEAGRAEAKEKQLQNRILQEEMRQISAKLQIKYEELQNKQLERQSINRQKQQLTQQIVSMHSTIHRITGQLVNLQMENSALKEQIVEIEKRWEESQKNKNNHEQSQRIIESLERKLHNLQNSYEQEKVAFVRGVDEDIRVLGEMVKEQEREIQSLHARYCREIDRLTAQNISLHTQTQLSRDSSPQLEMIQRQFQQQQQLAKEAIALASRAKQEQQAARKAAAQLYHRLQQNTQQILHLSQQNEKWRSYRKSQEEDARKQTRRFKKRVEELEELLEAAIKNRSDQLQNLAQTCEKLREQAMDHGKQLNLAVEEQRAKLSLAIEEMEGEMRLILRECDQKLIIKQQQLQQLIAASSIQNDQILKFQNSTELAYAAQVVAENEAEKLREQVEKLRRQLALVRGEVSKMQGQLKRKEVDHQSLKYSSQAQKDIIRSRYDRDMEQKVTEIQRLKLEVAQLTEDLRKNMVNKKHFQTLQLSLANKDAQVLEAIQHSKYMENMVQTYQQEIMTLKITRQQQLLEKQQIKSQLASSCGRFSQFQEQLDKLQRAFEEKVWELKKVQNSESELRLNYDRLLAENTRGEAKLAEANFSLGAKERQIKELQSKAANLKEACNSEDPITMLEELQSKLKQSKRLEENLAKQIRQQAKQIADIIKELQVAKSVNFQAEDLKARLETGQLERGQKERLRDRCIELEGRQMKHQDIIQQQKKSILALSKDQREKIHQIDVLLVKISSLQEELNAAKLNQISNQHLDRKKREEIYTRIANLGLSSPQTRLLYSGNETTFLHQIYDTLKQLDRKSGQLADQLGQKKKLMLQLELEKENIYTKYQKYKAVAIEYKDRKEVQKSVLKNAYRFNEDVLAHCQSILKQEPRR